MSEKLTGALRELVPEAPEAPVDEILSRSRVIRRRRTAVVIGVPVVAVLAAVLLLTSAPQPVPTVILDAPPETVAGPNDTVYDTDTNVTVDVDGVLASDVRAVAIEAEDAADAQLRLIGGAPVVLSGDRQLDLRLAPLPEDTAYSIGEPAWLRLRHGSAWAQRGVVELEPGRPALIVVPYGADGPVENIPVHGHPALPPTGAWDFAVALGEDSHLVVHLRVDPVTGDDLGLPSRTSVPRTVLPLPTRGDVAAEMLADGTPVWVVHRDDGAVDVLDARSPHRFEAGGVDGRYAPLVGWCSTMPGFIDSPGASRWSVDGAVLFGPAPRGLTPYDATAGGDTVDVRARLAPAPRRTEPDVPITGHVCDADSYDAPTPGDVVDESALRMHDLSAWPARETARGDGWYRTDREGGVRGDLLVRVEGGVAVEIAGLPGTQRNADADPSPSTLLASVVDCTQVDGCDPTPCPQPCVHVQRLVLLDADGLVEPPTSGPLPPGTAVAPADNGSFNPHRVLLPAGTRTPAPGRLIRVTSDPNGTVSDIDELE